MIERPGHRIHTEIISVVSFGQMAAWLHEVYSNTATPIL